MKRDRNGLTRKDVSALDAAKLYYGEGLSQFEVAQALHIARPTVSKLLAHARDRGFVRIEVDDPRENDKQLTEQLKEKYGLAEVRLVSVTGRGPMDLRHALGRCAARLLEELVREGDTVGLSWSNTVAEIAQALSPQLISGVHIVQLRGDIPASSMGKRINQTYEKFTRAFAAVEHRLAVPAVFTSLDEKQNVARTVSDILRLGTESRIAVYSVGSTDRGSILFASDLLTDAEKQDLLQKSVGDVCGRYLNGKGQICRPELNSRTLGISLPDLRHKEQKVLVAGGPEKLDAIDVAARYGYANRLVTDVKTAHQLLQL